MSGEPPEPNWEQMTDSVPPQQTSSTPVGRYVPIAPTVPQGRLGTHANWLPLGTSSVGGPQIYPTMSGEPPEPNREQMTDSAPPQQPSSAPVRRYLPIAPTGLQERLGTHAILLPFGTSLVGAPQPTASLSGAALPETKKERGALTGKSVMDNSFVQLTFKCGENDLVALKRAKKEPGALTGKSVVVLKPCDVKVRNGTVFMPNTIEMAQLKKSEKGQFKTNVQISSKMTEMDIKRILVETFPYLESKRFYCAGAADNRTRLDFHGARRLWDGRLIKQKIKGNSALYIFAEGNSSVERQPPEQSAACSNTGPLLQSLKTSAATATTTFVNNAASLPFVSAASSVPGQSLVTTQPAQNAFRTSSLRGLQNPVASQKPTTKRSCGQMATPENEEAIHALKKLRAFEGISNDSRSERSLGEAAEMVCEKAFYQTDGRHAEIKGLPHESTQYVSASPVSHRNPVNQTARIATGPIPSYSTPVTVPVGNVPIGYPKGQDNSWKILSSETSTKQLPQSVYENQTKIAGDFLKNDNNVQLPACRNKSALTSLSNTSKQFPKEDKQVFNPMCLVIHNSNPDCRQETDEVAKRLLGEVLSEHKSSRECQSTGTAAEEQSPAVYAEGTNARERCVTQGDQEGLETSASDSESQLSDVSAHRPTDSGNETSASLTVGDGNLRLQVSIDPERVPYWRGGTVCCFDFEQTLPSHVQSGSAFFGNLAIVKVTRVDNSLIGRKIPARAYPGFEDIILKADSGETLGETTIEYYDDIEETLDTVVNIKILHPLFFEKMAVKAQNKSTDVQNSNSGGSTQPFETLELAVCVAAKCGAMQFIKTVFSSKAGRAICTEKPQLLAREHGYEEIANYLEELTTRFSKEAKNVAEESQEIDWQELITLAKAAIEKEERSITPDERTHPVENDCFDSGYLGDTETSSSEMSPPPSSDSESDDSEEDFGDMYPVARGTSKVSSDDSQQIVWEHRVQQDRSRREAELSSEEFPTRIKENHLRTSPVATGTASVSTGDERKAIPLCLPNNCKWNSHARECTKTEEQRSSLYVVDEAIEKLREVKGPVCVVSIAGPYRKGKSYILSEAFDQPNVFPLGHEMVAETMGIWLWIVPEKYKDPRGQEFTVVLLDSEGIDVASSVGYDDNQIFTLTVLLASVLIYNSQGVPRRRDLEGLDFIAKLFQRIQVRSNQGVGVKQKETELFHRTFPYFLWLLRDVTQAIPRDCKDLKDYLLKKVFRDQDSASLSSSRHQSQQVAESILRYFSGFEAFHLPPPTFEKDIMRTLNENRSQVRPQFLTKLEEFKTLLKSTLLPKHSCFDGQLVTGEGLAALTTLYVEAINTPGSVPNVQSAWETFVETKCMDARNVALDIYNTRMREVLSSKLPCDDDEIRKVHSDSLEKCQRHFMVETTGISTITTEKYLRLLKQSLIQKLTEWQTENTRLTKELCINLLSKLKRQHLGPILHQLQGHSGSNLSFDDIIGVYHRIKDDYEGQAVGAKDVIAASSFDFQPELARETKQYLEILRQMKNFDEKAAHEMRVKAYQERERKRLEEQQLRCQQENQEHKRETEMLITRLEKERVQYRQQLHSELESQRVQMQNMMAANMKQAFINDNLALAERFLEVQRSIEENMKLIRNMTALIARQHKEKEVLRENAKELPRDKMEGLMNEMSERHTYEVIALLKKTDGQFEGAKKLKQETSDEGDENTCHKNLDEVPEMIKLSSEAVEDVRKKITETHLEQEKVVTSSYTKNGLKVITRKAVPRSQIISIVQPETAPFAVPASDAICTTAEALSNVCCVM